MSFRNELLPHYEAHCSTSVVSAKLSRGGSRPDTPYDRRVLRASRCVYSGACGEGGQTTWRRLRRRAIFVGVVRLSQVLGLGAVEMRAFDLRLHDHR